jgi:hypothetical protein
VAGHNWLATIYADPTGAHAVQDYETPRRGAVFTNPACAHNAQAGQVAGAPTAEEMVGRVAAGPRTAARRRRRVSTRTVLRAAAIVVLLAIALVSAAIPAERPRPAITPILTRLSSRPQSSLKRAGSLPRTLDGPTSA